MRELRFDDTLFLQSDEPIGIHLQTILLPPENSNEPGDIFSIGISAQNMKRLIDLLDKPEHFKWSTNDKSLRINGSIEGITMIIKAIEGTNIIHRKYFDNEQTLRFKQLLNRIWNDNF